MTAGTVPSITEDLAAVVDAEIAHWSVPGMAVGVLHGGATEVVAAGVASLETGFPVLPDTLFQVGSISKIVTTTLVMQLVDEGRIELDAPVATYLPSLQLGDAAAMGTVTVRHLLTHTSGFFGDRFDDYGGGDEALASAIDAFNTLRQYSQPGAVWAYNNNGFQLAGRVAEQVLGTPFEAAVRQRVFAPLGMDRTTYFAHEAITYPVATGHNLVAGRENEAAHVWARARCRNPQGGVVSTVRELLRFAGMHLAGGERDGVRVLSATSAAAMQTPQVEAIQAPHWGLGWWVDTIGGERIVGHGGVTNGFQAQLTLVPGRGTAFAFLSNGNQGGAAIRSIQAWLMERSLGLRTTEPPAIRLSTETLVRLAGRYEGALSRTSVFAEGHGLRLVSATVNPFTGDIAPPVECGAEAIGGTRFRITSGVETGSLFDFIEAAQATPVTPPRYLRLNNRLLDHVE